MDKIKLRVWDDVAKKMSYGEIEQFDDMLGFRFHHFETETPVYMQFTGLCDKSGKEIYKGDIIKARNLSGVSMSYIVKYSEFHCKYVGYNKDESYDLAPSNFSSGELMGNIYERPELLEGQ